MARWWSRTLACIVVVATATAGMTLTGDVASAGSTPTIDGLFAGTGVLGPGATLDLVVTGRGGVPSDGVDAVALNVTVTEPSAPSFVTVWPTGTVRPTASNLNFVAGQTVPNMVIAKVGVGGQVSLFNLTGTVHVLVDVLGWFPTAASFTSLTPARLLDTRPGGITVDGQSSGAGPIGDSAAIDLTVVGRGGVPAAGVDTVALNVTVTGATAASYLTVWPQGTPRPTASNLNFVAGQTVPNMVLAKVGTNGQISLFNFSGTAHVIVDVLGWFGTGGSYVGLNPSRLLDTRPGPPTIDPAGGAGPVPAGGTIAVTVVGRAGVPAVGVGAVALNVTATGPTQTSYVTVWPAGAPRPTASNLNVTAGTTVPNMVLVPVGADGKVSLYNFAGTVHLAVDILGWFPTGTGSFAGLTPARLLDTRPNPTPTPPSPPTPTPPAAGLPPGTYAVGPALPAGRYVAEHAGPGCQITRLASAFPGFPPMPVVTWGQGFTGRAVVDVLPTDASLEFSAGCGSLTPYVAPATFESSVGGGMHVVGGHIAPGTYIGDCIEDWYWERISSFATYEDIDAGQGLQDAQPVVTILASDVGFIVSPHCVFTRA